MGQRSNPGAEEAQLVNKNYPDGAHGWKSYGDGGQYDHA